MAFRTNKTPVLQEKSASGSVATFSTALAMPLKSHKIALTATQSGSGTPSPDNVRPISGWSAINIGSDNKYAGFINFNQLVKNGNFADTSNWVSRNGSLITASNNTLDITPVSNGLQVITSTIPINSNHRYLFMGQLKADSTSVLFGIQNDGVHARIQSNGNGMWQQCEGLLNNNNMNNDRHTVIVVFDNRTSDWTTTQLRNVIIVDLTQMFGSTKADEIYNMEQQTAGSGVAYFRSLFPNDYYEYNAGTLTTVSAVNGVSNSMFTIQLGSTIYGGEYDARTGVLTVTHLLIKGSNINFTHLLSPIPAIYGAVSGIKNTPDVDVADLICDIYETVSRASIGYASPYSSGICISGNYIMIADTSKSWATLNEAKEDIKNANIVYPLATPQTIQLPPCPIDTLEGVNNIWADTGDVDLTYKDLDIAKRGNFREVFKIPENTKKVYGFHIDSSVQDPSDAVTYLADAEGLTPAYMDYTNDKFEWGSWKDAFFMPKPCMLKSDGTVDYYLDENDYSKKADGTPSDVADDSYDGNAMIEWGRDNQRIWYKIEPDENDNTSASIFIANQPLDAHYKAWSFYNYEGNMVDHFYTPCYNGSLDANGKLRSISGKTYSELCQRKNVTQEVAAAELNNPVDKKIWYTEQYCDITLMNLLLILISKSLDTQTAFGKGRSGQTSGAQHMLGTGTMDKKGMFWGSSSNNDGVKVFGMENWWGNQHRRFAGLQMNDYQQLYKMTRSMADGSSTPDYNQTGSGYLQACLGPNASNYISKMWYNKDGFFDYSTAGNSSSKYYCDYWYTSAGLRFALRGGASIFTVAACGAFFVYLGIAASDTSWGVGAAVSCKPLL